MLARTRWYKTIRYILQRYSQTNCSTQAASLTLDTLLSLVPLLATSIALVSMVPSLQHIVINAEQKLLTQFVADTGQDIQRYLLQVTQQAAAVSIVGILFLLLTTIKLLYSLNQAFQAMLYARIRQKTRWEILYSCLAWILAPILAGISIAISSYVLSAPFVDNYVQQLTILKPLLIFIPVLLSTIAFSFLYMVSPLFIVPVRNVIYGAFCAAILFEITKWLFGLYIVYFPSYQKLYGTLAAIPLFLIWLNVSWQIVLLGALIAQALMYKERYRSAIKLDGFTHAICWLGHLWQAQEKQQQLTMTELIKKDKVSYQVEPEIMLDKLRELNFIDVTPAGEYCLAQNINELTLLDYFRLLPWKPATAEQLAQLDFSWKENLVPIMQALNKDEQKHLAGSLLTIFQDKK
jgi:membrane protein